MGAIRRLKKGLYYYLLFFQSMTTHLLDNPAWAALQSVQSAFAVSAGNTVRYKEQCLPFAACLNNQPDGLDSLTAPGDSLFLIGDMPILPRNWQQVLSLPCAQMIRTNEIKADAKLAGKPSPILLG